MLYFRPFISGGIQLNFFATFGAFAIEEFRSQHYKEKRLLCDSFRQIHGRLGLLHVRGTDGREGNQRRGRTEPPMHNCRVGNWAKSGTFDVRSVG